MGTYLNPGNKGFQEILQSEYVDKTGLIALVNRTVGTMEKLTCISMPRRFGKSYAAKMLCAYYDCSCDSQELFGDKKLPSGKGVADVVYLPKRKSVLPVIVIELKWNKSAEGGGQTGQGEKLSCSIGGLRR